MSQFFCYLNGEVLPVKDACIHISDLGLLRSYAVFDYLRTYKSKPFMLTDHLDRFRNSARNLRLPLDVSDEDIAGIIHELLRRSQVEDAGIRLVLTGGCSADAMTITEPNFMIIVEQLPDIQAGIYSEGVRLKTCEYMRDIPVVKSTHYLNAIKLQPLKAEHGVYDLLYFYGDEVLESPRNNFFIFKDRSLITAKDKVLKGITRKKIIELARNVFDVQERKLTLAEMRTADEAFICGTTKRIIPVVSIEGIPVGQGKVGTCTVELMGMLDDYIDSLIM